MKRLEARDLLQSTIHDRLAAAGELTPASISTAIAEGFMAVSGSGSEETATGEEPAAKSAKKKASDAPDA